VHRDEPVSSAYVAYRGATPMADVDGDPRIAPEDVVVSVGLYCHLVQYPLRRGECSTRSPCSASPRRWPVNRTGEPRTNWTRRSRTPARRCGPLCHTCRGNAGGGCTTGNQSAPGSEAGWH
jgi:salicylate hydroxylase